MQQVGQGATFAGGSANPETVMFAGGHFTTTQANPSEGAIASVATGVVNQTIAGYSLQSLDDIGMTVVGDEEILIPGKLLLETTTS